MRFISVATALFALTNVSSAWTQDANKVWTANNNWYWIRGDYVHEACTRMNTEQTHVGPCAYFTNNRGDIFRGHCAVVLGHNHKEIHCR
ncbi:hypothetical protein NW754_014471 [Fusarium falciforme]|uniref:Uncharacterized protein n=1 Tax=Fusarium falciforme TaxID=195108 RepID=A0A9W8R155_9HYPO|nr:hypothetical protein NW754_014471 [Fusarium falciforme]KAJ4181811.1 hypothetical protein NW755_010810 [Fusarium falciforme]KAJ4196135.1 hypothetical protein NW767_009595 [Fusarium falciforme]KAJ4243074.1 hypothetical protein NW757_011605 [Fusarium falciforme]